MIATGNIDTFMVRFTIPCVHQNRHYYRLLSIASIVVLIRSIGLIVRPLIIPQLTEYPLLLQGFSPLLHVQTFFKLMYRVFKIPAFSQTRDFSDCFQAFASLYHPRNRFRLFSLNNSPQRELGLKTEIEIRCDNVKEAI
jgi:hypothetical protein